MVKLWYVLFTTHFFPQSEVEETLTRIKGHKSVQGYIIVNNEANIIRSSYPQDEGESISKSIHQLTTKARSIIRDLDPTVTH